jgi:zinc-ribbon domain
MAAGQNFHETLLVNGQVEEVFQSVLASFNGTTGYQVNGVSPSSIVLTRKFRPTWVWVVAVIGFFFFFIGLLVLFYTETETVTVTLTAEKNKTQITIGGVGTPEILTLLTSSVSKFQRASQAKAPSELSSTSTSKVTKGKFCSDCGVKLETGVKFCPECGARA